ncbi:helix-turn-helix domain-containing protein [Solibacillus daqui]|uniref:helix-turn-helix domain-containing protein n=1 Tax=Solibacillus daqui TaxID=2912187 RepID=UPI002365087C|nr:helix-turn-helix domain-containing protein [Solibacillus daqui]
MKNKVEILMHPVRIKISQALLRNREHGLTPLEMVKILKDVPQATLYRQLQILVDAGIISVIQEKKVKSVSEKYYAINENEIRINGDEWSQVSTEEKLDYISYYQLLLMTQYKNYLEKLEEENSREDRSTFSVVELKIDENHFTQFQNELHELMTKYFNASSSNQDAPVRTVAITIIPEN